MHGTTTACGAAASVSDAVVGPWVLELGEGGRMRNIQHPARKGAGSATGRWECLWVEYMRSNIQRIAAGAWCVGGGRPRIDCGWGWGWGWEWEWGWGWDVNIDVAG